MSQARILAVDDQLYFRVFLEDLLENEGHVVRTAPSGEDALTLLESESFDIVLTDLVMPGMDGSDLVQRVKERWPEQDIVVVTSVGDVRTAVDAMKLGATDYLLKPLDRVALLRSLDGILQQQRMREEHQRLMDENLEYMGVFTQYERALGLFSSLQPEPLADRIVETFCLETNAHGGVLWLAQSDRPHRLRLAGAGGLVRVEDEAGELDAEALPAEFRTLAEPGAVPFVGAVTGGAEEGHSALYVPLRRADALLGILRLRDKIDGGDFAEAELEVAGRLGEFASQAVANALEFRTLERRSFRDPTTQAYTRAYFEDVVHNEVQKASRFGRTFSLVQLRLDPIGPLRSGDRAGQFQRWVQDVAAVIGECLRTTDLLAAETEQTFSMLLPETDALGAAVAKRRLQAAVSKCAPMRDLPEEDRPAVLAAAATFPADGMRLDALSEVLAERLEEDRKSLVRAYELEGAPFSGLVDVLLADAPIGRPQMAQEMSRLLIDEVARRSHERGLFFLSPGAEGLGGLTDGLEELRDLPLQTEVVLLCERDDERLAAAPITFVSPDRAGTTAPFLVYYGEGPPYALIQEAGSSDDELAVFHSSDPVLVEHLAFQLGRDLGIPIGE